MNDKRIIWPTEGGDGIFWVIQEGIMLCDLDPDYSLLKAARYRGGYTLLSISKQARFAGIKTGKIWFTEQDTMVLNFFPSQKVTLTAIDHSKFDLQLKFKKTNIVFRPNIASYHCHKIQLLCNDTQKYYRNSLELINMLAEGIIVDQIKVYHSNNADEKPILLAIKGRIDYEMLDRWKYCHSEEMTLYVYPDYAYEKIYNNDKYSNIPFYFDVESNT